MINQELTELTEKLFDEANNLVSAEARKRFEAETSTKRVLGELEEAKKQLRDEQAELTELKKRIEQYAADEEDAGHHFHHDSLYSLSYGSTTAPLSSASSTSPTSSAVASATGMAQSLPTSPLRREPGSGSSESESTASLPERYQPPPPLKRVASNPRQVFDARLFVEFGEFVEEVRRKNSRPHSLLFMKRCLEEDVEPCVRYAGLLQSRRLLDAIWDGTSAIEVIPPGLGPEVCFACDCRRTCTYRYRLREGDSWRPLDRFCRDRLVTVGDLYTFVRALQQGQGRDLSTADLYHEFARLRRQVFYARVGLLHLFPSQKKLFHGLLENEDFGDVWRDGSDDNDLSTKIQVPQAGEPAPATRTSFSSSLSVTFFKRTAKDLSAAEENLRNL